MACDGIMVLIDEDQDDGDIERVLALAKKQLKKMNAPKRIQQNTETCCQSQETYSKLSNKRKLEAENPQDNTDVSKKRKFLGLETSRVCNGQSRDYDAPGTSNGRNNTHLQFKEKKKTQLQNGRTSTILLGQDSTPNEPVQIGNNRLCGEGLSQATVSVAQLATIRHFDPSIYVSLDCEFVGTGPKGCVSALGRCTVVDYHGNVLCDVYSEPEARITDFRTRWSGLRPSYLRQAIPFGIARSKIKNIIRDKIVIGHAVFNDFRVLQLRHPHSMVRDTAKYTPLHEMAAKGDGPRPSSLKKLSKALLDRVIQTRMHCSREDAIATLDLFKLVQHQWESQLPLSPMPNSRERTFSESSADASFLNDRFWPSDM